MNPVRKYGLWIVILACVNAYYFLRRSHPPTPQALEWRDGSGITRYEGSREDYWPVGTEKMHGWVHSVPLTNILIYSEGSAGGLYWNVHPPLGRGPLGSDGERKLRDTPESELPPHMRLRPDEEVYAHIDHADLGNGNVMHDIQFVGPKRDPNGPPTHVPDGPQDSRMIQRGTNWYAWQATNWVKLVVYSTPSLRHHTQLFVSEEGRVTNVVLPETNRVITRIMATPTIATNFSVADLHDLHTTGGYPTCYVREEKALYYWAEGEWHKYEPPRK
jgi:hypothetical protein